MARRPHITDYHVQVEGIGQFTFARRKLADEVSIQVEYARILDGVQPTEWLALVGGCLSALRVLTVRAPEDWDIDELDPLEDESYAKLMQVHAALVSKERSFRRKPTDTGEADGQGNGPVGGVLVSEEIQSDG